MGGAVSSGESNDELIDNLKNAAYIKNPNIEKVFRAVDRAMYYTDPNKRNAYKDLAWKDGNLHLSAPCIYSEVMENIELGEGMSFLNLGSGTGYLSTLCGLIMGVNGINHGVELFPDVIEYARNKLEEFIQSSPAIDLFDFCRPEFVAGNCLHPISASQRYDRIYCGAACPEEALSGITNLLKVGGICIVPINDSLVKLTRVEEDKIDRKSLLPVSFATMVHPRTGEIPKSVILPDWNPPSLKDMCRSGIRNILLKSVAASSQGEDQRKKKRKRKQEWRRANRLLVVQRRRSGADGETGFVAVAYSLENNSSDDDDHDFLSPQNSDSHNTESLDSDDILDQQAQLNRIFENNAEQQEDEMDSLIALNPNVPEGYHIEDNPSVSNSAVSPHRQSNGRSSVSSSSYTTVAAEAERSQNHCATSSIGAFATNVPDSPGGISSQDDRDRAGDESGRRVGMFRRYRPSRSARNPVPTACRGPPAEGVRGRIQEQYRRARMDWERDVEEESNNIGELLNSDNTQFDIRSNRPPAAIPQPCTGNEDQSERMGSSVQNSHAFEESSQGSTVVAATSIGNTGAENSPGHEAADNQESIEESNLFQAQVHEEEMWSIGSSDISAMSSSDEEEVGEPRRCARFEYIQPRMVSERMNSNRTSGSTDSGVAVNESENHCQSQTTESKETETGDAQTGDEETDSAINYCTLKITEKINTLPIAPTLKKFLNYNRQIDGKYRKQETDLSFLR